MKKNDKKSKLGKILTIVLSTCTALFIMIFVGIAVFSNLNKKKMEADFLQSVNNCVEVCLENAALVEIPDVDFVDNVMVYKENIENQTAVLSKAYIANAMATYVIDTMNLNDPRTNYELAMELGDRVDYHGKLESYEEYVENVYVAKEEMLALQENYLISSDENESEVGLTQY